MMKKPLYIILSLLILISCNQKNEIDGIWFIAYTKFENEKTEPRYAKTFFEFDNGSVYIINLEERSATNPDQVLIDTAGYQLNNNILQVSDAKFDMIYSKDSIIIPISDDKTRITVLKRMNPKLKEVDIGNNCFKGSYLISGKNYRDSINFINDSISLFTGEYNINYPTNKWEIVDYKGLKIFNIYHNFFPLFVIQSCAEDKIVLKFFFQQDDEFILTPTTTTRQPQNFIGEWNEIKGSFPKPPLPVAGDENDQYYKVNFDKDSVQIKIYRRNQKLKWDLSNDGSRIYFIDKIMKNGGSWKIIDLSDSLMTVGISGSLGSTNELIKLKKSSN